MNNTFLIINFIILISIYLIAILPIVLFINNAWFDKLKFLPEEEILFEEEDIDYITKAGVKQSYYKSNKNTKLFITNKRIILTHLPFISRFFKKKYVIRFIINYINFNSKGSGLSLAQNIKFTKFSYLTYFTSRENIKSELFEKENCIYIIIPPPKRSFFIRKPIEIVIFTKNADEYMELIYGETNDILNK